MIEIIKPTPTASPPPSGRGRLRGGATRSLRRVLRWQMTRAELAMWVKLRNRNLGYKFRRQHSIGSYIADFCCPALKLVVEIDGDVHYRGRQPSRDVRRQRYLESQGYRVVRYSNVEVLANVDNVLSDLWQACRTPTHPFPSTRGRVREGV